MPETSTALTVVSVGNYAVMQSSPEDIRAILTANVGAGGGSDFDLDRLRVPAGGGRSWEIPGLAGPEPAKSVEGVIVAGHDARAYWAKGLEASGGGTPPDCSSVDAVYGVGTPGGKCDMCPMAQFGSAPPKGEAPSRGQACKLSKLLFLVRPTDMLPLVVVVPPSSLKAVKRYMLRLASKMTPIYGVVTALELEQARSRDAGVTYSTIVPRYVGQLEPAAAARLRQYGEDISHAFARMGVDAGDVREEPLE